MKPNKYVWMSLVILAGISALAYLPLVSKFGYFFDDWYLMYDVQTQGAQFFHAIFSSDRPGRAYLMIPMYSLFGLNPLPYNLMAYLFRFLGGVTLFWVLRLLWSEKKFLASTAAILFTIYPGFLTGYNAIDYQSHIFALFVALLSVAWTLKSMLATGRGKQVLFAALSVVSGWVYLSQMEYYIGLEAFRLACIVLLVWRSLGKSIGQKIQAVILKWIPFAFVPAGFLFWRVFLFQTERKATDIGIQLGQLFTSPLTALWWTTYLIQDMVNVLFVAWILPLSMFVFPMRLQNQLIGFGLAALAVALFILGNRSSEANDSEIEADSSPRGMREQVWIGLMGIVGGLAPVIAANRHIIFPDLSRYSLIASIGAVILLVALIEQISSRSLRIGAAGFLIAIGVLTHYGNSVRAAAETDATRDFWWQVAWRAPDIKSGTTLSASFPGVALQEDYFIWGPANHIYYPDGMRDDPAQVELSGVVLNDDNVSRILVGRGQDSFYRRGDVLIVNDFTNVLVMAQATENSCVRIFDGNAPEFSVSDQHRTMLIAPRSKLDNVVADAESHVPPALIFGDEPPHEWCYYYQRADLARQQGEWEKVAALYKEAVNAGHHPNDQIELMPFVQAYAYLGNQKMVRELSTRINTHIFYKEQTCRMLTGEFANSLTPEMQVDVDELFCQ